MAFQNTYEYDENLFNRLRLLRLKIAREKHLPAYMVFSDSTLKEIVTALPETEEEFSIIKGVGEYKLKQYASIFVQEIAQYKKQQPDMHFAEIHTPRPNAGDALRLITRQSPGIAELDNYEEIKATLEKKLSAYKTIAYTEASLKDAKFDKASLNKLRKAIDSRKKYIKSICMEPYKQIEPLFKELLAMIDEPLSAIDAYISDMEDVRRDAKCSEIKLYYDKHAAPLKNLSETVFCSTGFYESRWENASVSKSIWQADVLRKIQIISEDIETIYRQYGEQAPALINKYLEQCSLEDVADMYEAMRPALSKFSTEVKTHASIICSTPDISHTDSAYVGLPRAEQSPDNVSVLLKVSGPMELIMDYMVKGAKEGLEISLLEKL